MGQMAAEDYIGQGPSSPDSTVESSFDDLTRGVASGNVSRGKALRLMGAALLGGALASVPGVAWARAKPCKDAGQKCTTNTECCSTNCELTKSGKLCGLGSGGGGGGGDRVCRGNQRPCGTGCIPRGNCCVDTDCSGTQVCTNGTCVEGGGGCPSGTTLCNGN